MELMASSINTSRRFILASSCDSSPYRSTEPLTANARFLEFPFVNATVLKGESAAAEVRIDRVIRFSDWLMTLVLPITNVSDVARAAEIDPACSLRYKLQSTMTATPHG